MQFRLWTLVFVLPVAVALASLFGPSVYRDPDTWTGVYNILVIGAIVTPFCAVALAIWWSRDFMAQGFRATIAISFALLYAAIFAVICVALLVGVAWVLSSLTPEPQLM